jgi:hypothetical protein
MAQGASGEAVWRVEAGGRWRAHGGHHHRPIASGARGNGEASRAVADHARFTRLEIVTRFRRQAGRELWKVYVATFRYESQR